MLAVYEKELKAYFRSSIGPIFIGLFLLASTLLFVFGFLMTGYVMYTQYLYYLNLVFMLTVPILTMRTLSEERKTKTDQLLLTSPLKASDIVIGKYLAAVTVLLITLLIHSLDAIVISLFATNMYFLDVVIGYFGLFIVGCAYVAIGIFVSSTTTNQVISAIVTFAVLALIYGVQLLSTSVVSSVTSGIITCGVVALLIALLIYTTTKNKIVTLCILIVEACLIGFIAMLNINIYAGLLNTLLTWVSLLERFTEYLYGSVSFSSLVYILSFSFVFVYITIYQVEKRRWVG